MVRMLGGDGGDSKSGMLRRRKGAQILAARCVNYYMPRPDIDIFDMMFNKRFPRCLRGACCIGVFALVLRGPASAERGKP
jgi:hypothetical protein